MSQSLALTPEELDLAQKAAIGRQLVDFSKTKAFDFLIDRAQQMRDDALEALADVNPADTAKIMELQVQARVGASFEEWLVDTIETGEQAEREFTNRRLAQPD